MGGCSSVPARVGEEPAKTGWVLKPEVCPAYDASKGPFWVSQTSDRREVVFAASGPGSEAEMPLWTFSQLFKKAAEAKKDCPAMRAELPVPALGADNAVPPALPLEQWKSWTWGEYYDECRCVAKAMLSMGAQRFDGAVIYGLNSPYWVFSQMSAILAGVLPAGIYPTDTLEQIEYKTQYADAAFAMCGDEKHYRTFASLVDKTPKLKAIVTWNYEAPVSEIERQDGSKVRVMTWAQLLELGKQQEDAALEAALAAQDARECVALVFTSGTTGKPKAVMLSHDNLTFQARVTIGTIENFGNSPERGLSYLPLSHVAGLIVDIVLPMAVTATLEGYHTLFFARPYDLKAGSLGDRLRFVKPTSFLGVPRVWEKVAEKMRAKGASVKGLKKKVAVFAKGKGLEYEENRLLGGSGAKPAMYDFAYNKVLIKVKEALGLDECKIAISGAAPMPKELQTYFGSLGISINDTYGMSECGGATTGNNERCHQWGTVGQAFPGTEVRVFNVNLDDVNVKSECPRAKDIFNPTEAEQGELCYRGRHIMLGYYANPALGDEHVAEIRKKNAETIDSEGYLHSGDKGTCSELNMFRVTGRFKELIIGAGGENIAPVPVEDNVKKLAPGISNIVMVGDQRKFNVALVTLRAEGATGELRGTGNLDKDVLHIGSPGTTTIAQAMSDPKWIKHIQDAIETTNATGEVCQSPPWKIQKFSILPYDLSIEGLELTPTLKTKRSFVTNKYMALIDHMYTTDTVYVNSTGKVEDTATAEATPAKVEDAKVEEAKAEDAKVEETKAEDAAAPAKQ